MGFPRKPEVAVSYFGAVRYGSDQTDEAELLDERVVSTQGCAKPRVIEQCGCSFLLSIFGFCLKGTARVGTVRLITGAIDNYGYGHAT